MAVTHAIGFARDLNLNCPTETSTLVHLSIPVFAAFREKRAASVSSTRSSSSTHIPQVRSSRALYFIM
jgi:hypothetical protein